MATRKMQLPADYEEDEERALSVQVAIGDGAHWARWAWRACDAWALADMARAAFADIAPEACWLFRHPLLSFGTCRMSDTFALDGVSFCSLQITMSLSLVAVRGTLSTGGCSRVSLQQGGPKLWGTWRFAVAVRGNRGGAHARRWRCCGGTQQRWATGWRATWRPALPSAKRCWRRRRPHTGFARSSAASGPAPGNASSAAAASTRSVTGASEPPPTPRHRCTDFKIAPVGARSAPLWRAACARETAGIICAAGSFPAAASGRCSTIFARIKAPVRPRHVSAQVGRTRDSLRITDEGPAGMFVNNSGYVHDLVALRRVRPECIALQGRPTAEHCWFRGYAWSIAVCSRCGTHLVSGPQPLFFFV